jgi:hypothetical protein
MALVIFNRKDPQVIKDAQTLSEELFLEKYVPVTTEAVLKTVYKSHSKDRSIDKLITATSAAAADFPEAIDEDKTNISSPSIPIQQKKATPEPKVKKEKSTVKVEDGGKTRATRIRELIAEGKDKAATKEILTAEEYDVSGTVFHSEWARLNKVKEPKEA